MNLKIVGGLITLCSMSTAVALVMDSRSRDAEISSLQKQVSALTALTRSQEGRDLVPGPGAQLREALLQHVRAESTPETVPVAEKADRPKKQMTSSDVTAVYRAGFEEDRTDPTFTERQRREIVGKFEDVLPEGSAIRGLDCRESMCRLETSHSTADSFRSFVRQALMTSETQAWNGAVSISVDADHTAADGSVVSVAFLAREGHELPRIE